MEALAIQFTPQRNEAPVALRDAGVVEATMHHCRDYADTKQLKGAPSDVGYLGVPRAAWGLMMGFLVLVGFALGIAASFAFH